MPYVFAHPAAVIPLSPLLGRLAVPSALVIGSVIPDAWYLVPLLSRADSHSMAGLLWFCLPAGLFAYTAFHLIFKQPLLALAPQALAERLRAWACPGLPAVPWRAVVASLAAGGITHFAWDAVTHLDAFPFLDAPLFSFGRYPVRAHQLLQHASTLLGAAFLAWWVSRKLRAAPAASDVAVCHLPGFVRAAILSALLAAAAAAFWIAVAAVSPSSLTFAIEAARLALRPAGVTALSTLGLSILAYCVLWRCTRWNRGPARLSDP